MTDYRDLETCKWCPVCKTIYHKSADYCRDCNVLLLMKFAYQFGYDEGFPDA